MANVTTRIIDISALRSVTSYMDSTSDWLGRTGESQEVFDRMMDDPRVGSLVELRKDRVQMMEPSFSDCGDAAVDKAVRDNLTFNLFFNLNNILLNAVPFGISACEILWERSGSLLVPRAFTPIPRRALSFPASGPGYMVPYLTAQGVYLSDPHKFIIHRNDSGDGDRWGSPVLRRAYWPWKFKNMGFDFWIFAAKKIGVPTVLAVFESRSEADARARAKDLTEALAEWEAGSSGALGNVRDIKVIDSQIKDFNLLVEACNAEIAYALTGQSLATNQAQYGTRAQSDTHLATFAQAAGRDAWLLQQTDQKLVNAFCGINFPGRPVPSFDIDSTDTADWAVVREAIDRGVPVSLKALYEKYRIPEPQGDGDAVTSGGGYGFSDGFFLRTQDRKP